MPRLFQADRTAAVKILVDENMPYARELFSRTGEVVAVPSPKWMPRCWPARR